MQISLPIIVSQFTGMGIYPVTQPPYNATGDGTTDDTAAIQAAIDAAYAAGGGVVFLPEGTYMVNGGAAASDGSLNIKSNVILQGVGIGATIIKLMANQTHEITGILRSPSGEQTTNYGVYDLTVDGNDANNTEVVKGIYTGVGPSNRCTVSVAGTTGTLTSYTDAGTAVRSHGLLTGDVIHLINDFNEGLRGDFTFTKSTNSVGTITVAAGTSSDLVGYTWFFEDPEATCGDEYVSFVRVECKNCQDYNFDFHERTQYLTVKDCVSRGGGTSCDGFTFDGIIDSVIEGNYSHTNGRNGFNFITSCKNLVVQGNVAHNNGQYGFASQRGSTSNGSGTQPKNFGIIFKNNISRNNTQYGFRILMSRACPIEGNHVYENGRDGIRLEGATQCVVTGNNVHDNSQTTTNTYPEINVLQYALTIYDIGAVGNAVVTYGSTYNEISQNYLDSSLIKKANYSGVEVDDASDFNRWHNNRVITVGATGGVTIPAGNTGSNTGKQMDLALHAGGAGAITTTITAALMFVASSTEHRGATKVDLRGFTQVRLVTRIRGTAGAAGTVVSLGYSLSDSTTPADYVTPGASAVECTAVAANTTTVSAWIDLTVAARADVFISAMASGGDGVTAVTVGSIHAQFR